ncbi:MAG: hypothetical protein AB7G93_09645 [Bdellovibrionales bacterium]
MKNWQVAHSGDDEGLIKASKNAVIDAMTDVLNHMREEEGTMMAQLDDWIIKGIKGEFYPCKPDIFEAAYEPA